MKDVLRGSMKSHSFQHQQEVILVSQLSLVKLDNTFQPYKVMALKNTCKMINHARDGECLIFKVKAKLHELQQCCSYCLEKSEGDWITDPNIEDFSFFFFFDSAPMPQQKVCDLREAHTKNLTQFIQIRITAYPTLYRIPSNFFIKKLNFVVLEMNKIKIACFATTSVFITSRKSRSKETVSTEKSALKCIIFQIEFLIYLNDSFHTLSISSGFIPASPQSV